MKKHYFSTMVRYLITNTHLPISILLMTLVSLNCFGDNIKTASGTGSTTTTDAGTYIDVASATLNIGTSSSDVESVLIVATFEVRTFSTTTTNNRTATFRLANSTNSVYSNTIDRRLEKDKGGDKGIGSLVYIFDVSSYSGDIIFKLQHTTSNSSYDNITSGTIVAIALGTNTNHLQLNNDMKSITTEVTVGDNTYTTVTGLTTDAISLPVSGAIYVAASINNIKTIGQQSQVGNWKLQQKKGLSGTWTDIGNEISRTVSSNDDEGIASVGLIVTGLARDDYSFRLQHKGPASPDIETLNTTLVAVALAYHDPTNGGRAFPAFSKSTASVTTSSATLVAALSETGSPDSDTDMFFYAQYNMSASDALDAPTFDMYLTDGSTYTYSSQDQQRRLSSSSDIGAGASVGLAETLLASTSYTASVRHASDGTIALTTSNIILSGFQTTDQPSEGYWIGVASGNETQWNNTANWSNGIIPLITTNVTIFNKTNEPVVGATASCNSLNVVTDGSVTVNSAQTLNIAGNLVVESGGSFIGNGTVSITGSVKTTRYVAKDIWHYISSPVAAQAINADFMTLNDVYSPNSGVNYNFYRWDEPENSWIIYGSTGTPVAFGDANFVNGRGYAATFASDRYLEFTGTRNSEDITATIYKTASSGREGWNLVGNPFLSPISLSAFTNATDNPNIEGTIKFWSEGSGWTYPSDNYAYWNSSGSIGNGTQAPSDQIGVAQGFMVEAKSNNVDVNFDSDMRTHANPNYFKQSDVAGIKLAIQYQDDFYNETLIALVEDATPGFDRDYDARKQLGEAKLFLYTEMAVTNDKLAIQGIPFPDDSPAIIPLVIKTGVSGEFTLSVVDIQNIDASTDILLEDNLINQFYDLKEVQEVILQLNEGVYDSRFYLHFNKSTGIEGQTQETGQISFYVYDNKLYVIDKELGNGTIQLFNIIGQPVLEKRYSETVNTLDLNLSRGYYIVKVTNKKNIVSGKIYIR